MIAELDIGNTRLKWRLVDGQAVIARGQCASDDAAGWAALVQQQGVRRLRVGNVAGAAAATRVTQLAAAWGLKAEFAAVVPGCDGLTPGYAEPGQLGVDRWLALLAAHQRAPDGALVVDAGSALTVDLLLGERHLGGYIVPGRRLMREALFGQTDAVKVPLGDSLPAPGRSTAQAVNNGLLLMALGLLGAAREQLQAAGLAQVPLLITGGDGEMLMEQVHWRAEWVPELVLDGLARALP